MNESPIDTSPLGTPVINKSPKILMKRYSAMVPADTLIAQNNECNFWVPTNDSHLRYSTSLRPHFEYLPFWKVFAGMEYEDQLWRLHWVWHFMF